MSMPRSDLMNAIAVTRFGLGARPGELARAQADPRAWLKAQIRGPVQEPAGNLPDSAARLATFRAYQQQRRAGRLQQAEGDTPQGRARQQRIQQIAQVSGQPTDQVAQLVGIAQATGVQEETIARARLAAETDQPFRERWVLFWANHFTVSAAKAQSAPLAGPFEREVIRPHAFGRFAEMLVASSRHPGMLLYLDQAQSVGPASPAVRRQARSGGLGRQNRQPGLNENLAREIMELHTVGVDAGYSQADVTEFARAMTGWSLGNPQQGETGRYFYRAAAHEPGVRTVMGKRYADTGEGQAYSIMQDLAAHPATGRHVARKLAVHFVSDDPPAALVDKLADAFTVSGGDLAEVATTLIDADEAWAPDQAKMKTPYELVISAHRALGVSPSRPQQIIPALNALGQPVFRAPSPKGWPDDAQTWAAPDALLKRLTWSEGFAAQVSGGPREPMQVALDAVGSQLRPATLSAILAAESRDEALTLLFMSPEFQRR